MPKGNHELSKKYASNQTKFPMSQEIVRREPTPTWWRIVEGLGVVAAIVYAAITWIMWRDSHTNFTSGERAWISVLVPTSYPLNGTSIPVVTQITNSGKTPARDVEWDVVATIFNKGEDPALGDFSVGHPHNHVVAGVVFPNAPVPLALTVVHYGPDSAEPIVPDDTLRQDIANGNRFIIFYGRVTYYDVFGKLHWTQFCTGSGTAIQSSLKKCISYNDVDNTSSPNQENTVTQTASLATTSTSHGPHGFLEWLNALSTVVIAFFAVVTGIAVWRQVKTAQDSERAWVMADVDWDTEKWAGGEAHILESSGSSGDNTTFYAVLTCRNEGKSPAWIEEQRATFEIVTSLPDTPNLESAKFIKVGPEPIGIGNALPPTTHIPFQPVAAGHEKNGTMMVIYGTVKYRDIFNKQRTTSFAYKVINLKLVRLESYPKYNEHT
jgi:hypothetical protein